MKKEWMNGKTISIVVSLAFFSFVFLGTEYLFDNMMSYVTNADGVVIAQGYILGISVIGFLLYPVLNRFLKQQSMEIVLFVFAVAGPICIFVVQQHGSYASILAAGSIAFIQLGILGSCIHYLAAMVFGQSRHLAKIVGTAYALGIFLQFLNNNLIDNNMTESVILSLGFAILVFACGKINRDLTISNNPKEEEKEETQKEEKQKCPFKKPVIAGITMLIIVALMTCIFASLDNAVTLVHAEGNIDIGQWPRLLLAVSGLVAGVLFDIKNRRYMNMVMYSITLLSTACVVVIELGGPFLAGLIVFYLSAGFFVVYFTTVFMDLAGYMKVPAFWAGIGRATNNLFAVITSIPSVALLVSWNDLVLIVTALILFVLISIAIFVYSGQIKLSEQMDEAMVQKVQESDEEKFANFAEAFLLTPREQEILKILLSSDENVQDIADKLFLSRAALYRYISNLNEKTGTKSRIGLMQFYYGWKESD